MEHAVRERDGDGEARVAVHRDGAVDLLHHGPDDAVAEGALAEAPIPLPSSLMRTSIRPVAPRWFSATMAPRRGAGKACLTERECGIGLDQDAAVGVHLEPDPSRPLLADRSSAPVWRVLSTASKRLTRMWQPHAGATSEGCTSRDPVGYSLC